MKRTASLFIIFILTAIVFPVTMNDYGNFISDENSEYIQFFGEGEKIKINDNKIYAIENKFYVNDKTTAELKDFFTIITSQDGIFVITRKTIFSFSGDELKPVISFNDKINDITYIKGNFHVSLKNKIYNGYKFTHNIVSENVKVSRVGYTILDLKKNHIKNNTADTSTFTNKYINDIL
ncbi:MAG: hypothetical protein PF638_15965 [Candidatus Delongbacteria bacterium]|nr:hypothetical protein [Candidatus Delongbacteria bacterium]